MDGCRSEQHEKDVERGEHRKKHNLRTRNMHKLTENVCVDAVLRCDSIPIRNAKNKFGTI